MSLTKQELIQKLRLEKSIAVDGGYGRSVRTRWREPQYFRDSITCPNVGESEKIHPCSECFLSEYFHPSYAGLNLPCHFIPLNAEGETLDSLIRQGDVKRLELVLVRWIDATIKKLEESGEA